MLAAVVGIASALGTQAQPAPLTPLTYQTALDLALARSLTLQAARHQRAIREAAVRAARQIPNPDVTLEVTRDTPHEMFSVDVPVEIGGRRGRRVDLAKQELTLADVDVRTAQRVVRKSLRQGFYTLVA